MAQLRHHRITMRVVDSGAMSDPSPARLRALTNPVMPDHMKDYKMSKFGAFDTSNLSAVQAEAVATCNAALSAVKAAAKGKDKAVGTLTSLNRDVAVMVVRAVVGGFMGSRGKDVEKGTLGHTLQAHGAFAHFKATVSQARTMAELLHGPNGISITIPETKRGNNGWTLAGVLYEEGDTLSAGVILAGLLDPADVDTSPLNLAKTIAKIRSTMRADETETAVTITNALAAYLATTDGEAEAESGITAEDIFADGRGEDGEWTPETLAKIASGEAALKARTARLAAKAAQSDVLSYVAQVVGFIASDKFTEDHAAEIERAVSVWRASQIVAEPAQVHAAQSAAA